MSDFDLERYRAELEQQKNALSQRPNLRYTSLNQLEKQEKTQPLARRRVNNKASAKKEKKLGQRQKTVASKRQRRKYKVAPLVVVGLAFAFLFALLAVLVYTIYCYFSTKNGNVSVIAPTIIYFGAIAVGSLFVSAIIRCQSLKPAMFIAAVFLMISLVYSFVALGWEHVKFSTIPYKIACSILAAIFGYLLALLPSLLRPKKRRVHSKTSRDE